MFQSKQANLNRMIANNKDFRNPSIYDRLLERMGIDQLGLFLRGGDFCFLKRFIHFTDHQQQTGTNSPDTIKWEETDYFDQLGELERTPFLIFCLFVFFYLFVFSSSSLPPFPHSNRPEGS